MAVCIPLPYDLDVVTQSVISYKDNSECFHKIDRMISQQIKNINIFTKNSSCMKFWQLCGCLDNGEVRISPCMDYGRTPFSKADPGTSMNR